MMIVNTTITLRAGHRPPFYKGGRIVTTELNESQRNRYDVQVRNKNRQNLLVKFIDLIIKDVQREDAGTYTCEVYSGEQKLADFTRKLHLSVEFPPSNATCIIDSDAPLMDPDDPWVLLSCSAMLGSDPGFISCYQNGEVMPWKEQIQNTTHLVQKMWVHKSSVAFCCSSTYNNPIDICNCTHSVWKPEEDIKGSVSPCEHTPLKTTASPTTQYETVTPSPMEKHRTDEPKMDAHETPWEYQVHVIIVNSIVAVISILLLFILPRVIGLLQNISNKVDSIEKRMPGKQMDTSVDENRCLVRTA